MNQKKYINRLKALLSKDEFYLFQEDKDNLIELGCSYLELEDYKKAFKIFGIGLRLLGHDPDILNGLGVTLCELGKLKIAKTYLRTALELYPDDAASLGNLAGVFWEEGDYDKAIYYYNKSISRDSEIMETHLNLINLYYEQGDLFMAYITSLNLLNYFPNDSQAIAIRNDIILDLGISFI